MLGPMAAFPPRPLVDLPFPAIRDRRKNTRKIREGDESKEMNRN